MNFIGFAKLVSRTWSAGRPCQYPVVVFTLAKPFNTNYLYGYRHSG